MPWANSRTWRQQVSSASAGLEGRLATATGRILGDLLRRINSYYNNRIEGHQTTLPEIEDALNGRFQQEDQKRYAQELCLGHINCERWIMTQLDQDPSLNVAAPEFLLAIHAEFYAHLPERHLYAHYDGRFTDIEVRPGQLRDFPVSVKQGQDHRTGPCRRYPRLWNTSDTCSTRPPITATRNLWPWPSPTTGWPWLHPFRDGNGRVARLFSSAYLARIGVNRRNLWSLSRGLSRQKQGYMFNLDAADQPAEAGESGFFSLDMTADFCRFFFRICLDQIGFMAGLLELEQIEQRLDEYVRMRSHDRANPLPRTAARLLRAAFMRGSIRRGEAGAIANTSDRTARRIVSQLLAEGLLTSNSPKGELLFGIPQDAVNQYFPRLYEPGVAHEEGLIL